MDLDNYNALLASQQATLSSEPPCPGDGNEDKLVNQPDLDNWTYFSGLPETSSWYDLNMDGFTNSADYEASQQTLGQTACGRRRQKAPRRRWVSAIASLRLVAHICLPLATKFTFLPLLCFQRLRQKLFASH